ncbi:MAG: hypothetical protein HY235_19255 [Acidobacteria bacterium]|nr:hypothetical protein [Acidobacteriota bacterium]
MSTNGRAGYYQQLAPAANLRDIPKTLLPQPLLTKEELDAFYRPDLNEARAPKLLAMFREELRISKSSLFFRKFLVGNRGVGKSSELTCLLREVEADFLPIRFSVSDELDALHFRIFDVLFLMMTRVIECMKESVGSFSMQFPEDLAPAVKRFLSQHKVIITQDLAAGAEVEGGFDSKTGLSALLGILLKAKVSLKYAADRKKETVEYSLQRISELVALLNQVFEVCHGILRTERGRDLLIIGEDFDKDHVAEESVVESFVKYGSVFRDLQVHQIYTLPLDLLSSRYQSHLPFDFAHLPDTPVFDPQHRPQKDGRAALRAILEKRFHLHLASDTGLNRLVVASGGNLRILFEMVRFAAMHASVSGAFAIGDSDVSAAVDDQRMRFSQRLGSSRRFDEEGPSLEAKIEKLLRIFRQEPGANIPDDTLHALIHALAVQFFDGKQSRYGVHPIVVDLLKGMGKVDKNLPGGTE